MLIDLTQLRTFAAVAEEQHLTRAAERLHISQSAASVHIRAVEDTLGVKLFERNARGLELTSAGRKLLQRARALLSEAAELASQARELSGQVDGRLVIGAPSDPQATRVAEVIAALRQRHPLVHVALRQRPSMSALKELKTGELDAALCLGHADDAALSHHLLAQLRYRVAGPSAWAPVLATAEWSDLARLPWLGASASSVVSNQLTKEFARRGLSLNEVVAFDNAAIARQMVALGAGVMLMREEYALAGERDGTLSVSPIAGVECPLFFSCLAGRERDPLIRALLEVTGKVWPQLGAETSGGA